MRVDFGLKLQRIAAHNRQDDLFVRRQGLCFDADMLAAQRRDVARRLDAQLVALDERIVAYLAMNESYMARMYVDPGEWRKGWGTQFVNFAKQLSPRGLELHTHQQNRAARALYEAHGFKERLPRLGAVNGAAFDAENVADFHDGSLG